jgi:FdrA protein
MAAGYIVRKNQYYDSVFLMGVNKRLSQVPDVRQTAVLMGSENNKRLLAAIGIHGKDIETAQASDLIVAVIAETQQAVEAVLGNLDQALLAVESGTPRSGIQTFEEGLALRPSATLAVLTIPGEYVYREASKALEAGLHVFIFSSNVPIEDERKLKEFASERHLLVMGPDCGTSILGGVGIGFANVVRRGRIGVIGPSGTGLQEFTTQVHHAGHGISHAIGTGSHDLSDQIGGITTLAGLEALEADPQTDVIAIIAKPPGPETIKQLYGRLKAFPKPVVGCFLGVPPAKIASQDALLTTRTIDDAVQAAIRFIDEAGPSHSIQLTEGERRLAAQARSTWAANQQFLRGLFSGGTFCYQTQQILQDQGLATYSNTPLNPDRRLQDRSLSVDHTLLDMGDEVYTLGRPHPMIDGTLRRERILLESHDATVAILLLDFILGYNASEDPVGDVLDSILEARGAALARGGQLTAVASMCGTEADPQDLDLQQRLLENAGVIVFRSSARAALFCGELLKGR